MERLRDNRIAKGLHGNRLKGENEDVGLSDVMSFQFLIRISQQQGMRDGQREMKGGAEG